ncbi:error-prone DNA polymerase [Chitinasiproducens palmae]|uniref:Error-prone DNA polymerase n=1 Tax=Chitinasiproducens palmae TaxID=1770053 RepID=A0A1H2PPF8_9BURK|nr:error-prone DNA polymerase [Chitinasiproducens palmae]SDV48649.1 error-prone DNA polymerase [Chitinasiproducens palmae]
MSIRRAVGLPAYAELQCFTNFSFLRGASHPEEMVMRARELGYTALAITDECSLAGVVRAHAQAKREGEELPLLIGSYIQLSDPDAAAGPALTILACNRNGYGNLSELITLGRTRAVKGSYQLTTRDIEAPDEPYRHLRWLPDCLAVLSVMHDIDEIQLERQVRWLARTFFQCAWIGLTLHGQVHDDALRERIERAAQRYGLPIVALGGACMHVRSRKPLQDTLSAVRLRRPVSDCGYDLAANGEQHLRSRLRLANLYAPAALAQTLELVRRCTFSLDELRYEYPQELTPPGYTPSAYLRQETLIGAQHRFRQGIPAAIQAQVDKELALITELGYEPYFLTVYDLVRFARREGILCQGRGSAANSAVCYCLGVTEVDPARSSMLFERFISRERNEPPDIDIDFEHQRREEVVQYIYRKYGRDRAALAAAVATYRPRSALRDAGKALGVDALLVERVVKTHHWFDSSQDLLARFTEAGLDIEAPMIRQWAHLAAQLLGFPRHLSQHSGGFVISAGKLSRIVPIENAAMPERSVIEWDKDDLDAIGLLKVDVLALGMLSAIRRALALVSQRRGDDFEMQDIPSEDLATYDMICRADTVGVFQIESRAQMSMLPRMRPRTFYDLVIEVAIVRPGPIQGGMVHPYLRRRQKLEPVTYPSDEVKVALERTLGVPIFQEQVMQIAMLAAGFSAGEADALRRAMAAWRRKGGLHVYHERIVEGMLARGYEREFAESIFAQIQGFGEYGFPESHAASFALLVYTSSWLKCHEPAAFLCAMLNSQPMGFYSPSQLIQDARRHGVQVLPVDVTISEWDSTLEGECTTPAVRLGLSRVRGMREESSWRIEAARAVRPFGDVHDLARRAQLNRHDLQVLAAADALRTLAGHRRQALWQAVDAVPTRDLLREAGGDDMADAQFAAPSEGEQIVGDYKTMGFTLGRHPVALLRPLLLRRRLQSSKVLARYRNGQLARGCGLVTVRQRPGTAKGVMFVTIEDESGQVNVIVWPSTQERFRRAVLGASLMAVHGVWQCEGEVRHLVASRVEDLSHLLGDLPAASRNFF